MQHLCQRYYCRTVNSIPWSRRFRSGAAAVLPLTAVSAWAQDRPLLSWTLSGKWPERHIAGSFPTTTWSIEPGHRRITVVSTGHRGIKRIHRVKETSFVFYHSPSFQLSRFHFGRTSEDYRFGPYSSALLVAERVRTRNRADPRRPHYAFGSFPDAIVDDGTRHTA
jgi:hypothetical protein